MKAPESLGHCKPPFSMGVTKLLFQGVYDKNLFQGAGVNKQIFLFFSTI